MINSKTVVIINDRLGEMALAFQGAGFNVLCDALTDVNCIEIVQKNLNIEVLKLSEESCLEFPQASVFAGRLEKDASVLERSKQPDNANYINQKIYGYIERNLPKIFFLEASKRYIKSEEFYNWIGRFVEYGYRIEYRALKTEEITGVPIREERVYVIGAKNEEVIDFNINADNVNMVTWEEILDKRTEEPWLSFDKLTNMKFEGDGIYDWKDSHYEKSGTVSLGWRMPRVVENGMARSLSIKEIAKIKGFPVDYYLVNNKSWLKRKLCGSANFAICKGIAEQIYNRLSDNEMSNSTLVINDRENKSTIKENSVKEEVAMERRYDVFVSSTYEDLVEERKEITQAVLECDCMPVGMEMFPASNMEQWEFIKKVIDKSDIYLIIVAGKYGSIGIDEQGNRISYTEMEFNYALKTGKPILVFLHKDINRLTRDRIELDVEKAKALEHFRKKLKNGRLVKFYSNKDELKANALSSINLQKKQLNTGGWIRSEYASECECRNLESRILELQKDKEELRRKWETEVKEKEQVLQQLKKVQIMFQKACEREKMLVMHCEKVKRRVAELVEEVNS